MDSKNTSIETLIIIPARSGSKGIADKNIRALAGKPLLQWIVEAIATARLDNALAILSPIALLMRTWEESSVCRLSSMI